MIRFVVALAAFPVLALAQAPTYSLSLVHDSPFGGRANVVNDAGVVGGSVATADPRGALDPSEAFLWQNGVVIWQGSLGVPTAGVGGLTEGGTAVGNAIAPDAPYEGEFAAFMRPAGGAIKAAPAPPIDGYRQVSYHGGINEAGLAAIRHRVRTIATGGANSPPYHVAVWNTITGEVSPLPHLSADSLYARATGVTASGVVVGAAVPGNGDIIHAVRWVPDENGEYAIEDLGTLGGGTYSEVNAVNASGVMFGEATTADNGSAQPAMWEPDGTGRILPMPVGAAACGAYDINSVGVGVGWCDIGRKPRAVVWIDDEPYDLNDRVDASAEGWSLTRAYGINTQGWIVGVGTRAGFVDSDGNPENFGFLIRPVGSVASEAAPAAESLALTVAPNPTAGSTSVLFHLDASVPVRAEVLDARGRIVETLADESFAAGTYRIEWVGPSAGAASGVYVVRVRAGDLLETRRIAVTR
ncbi:MAG: T9SS type A sorting domain-containing protein [Bacteroidota bacterium]